MCWVWFKHCSTKAVTSQSQLWRRNSTAMCCAEGPHLGMFSWVCFHWDLLPACLLLTLVFQAVPRFLWGRSIVKVLLCNKGSVWTLRLCCSWIDVWSLRNPEVRYVLLLILRVTGKALNAWTNIFGFMIFTVNQGVKTGRNKAKQ